jgi:hypothetical protein
LNYLTSSEVKLLLGFSFCRFPQILYGFTLCNILLCFSCFCILEKKRLMFLIFTGFQKYRSVKIYYNWIFSLDMLTKQRNRLTSPISYYNDDVYVYNSHLISEGVAETSQIFPDTPMFYQTDLTMRYTAYVSDGKSIAV